MININKKWYALQLQLLLICSLGLSTVWGQPAKKAKEPAKVLVMEIRSEIDPSMKRYVDLALDEAKEIGADYVIIDMDTYGGTLNDADAIRMKILNFPVPVYTFINQNAASAGALIAIASDKIYMTDGASIGAATVVNGKDGQAAPDKYQSYMRSIMRSTAEANGRNPKIAEAMVDQTIQLDSIKENGKVITFTTSEAIKYGYSEGKVSSIEDVMKENNISNYQLVDYELSTIEKIIAFFLNPFISGLLILAIIGGIYVELQTPGIGFPLAIAVLAAIFYFVPYYLNGLVANWEILAFIIGLALLAAEVFVIPGFGVAGISGIILLFGSLLLMMLDNDWFDFTGIGTAAIQNSLLAVLIGMLGSIVVGLLGGAKFIESKRFKEISLQHKLDSGNGYTSNFNREVMIGKTGTTYTVLRPSGKIMIEDTLYDAFTRGDYIERGTTVTVIDQEGSSLKVKRIQA